MYIFDRLYAAARFSRVFIISVVPEIIAMGTIVPLSAILGFIPCACACTGVVCGVVIVITIAAVISAVIGTISCASGTIAFLTVSVVRAVIAALSLTMRLSLIAPVIITVILRLVMRLCLIFTIRLRLVLILIFHKTYLPFINPSVFFFRFREQLHYPAAIPVTE